MNALRLAGLLLLSCLAGPLVVAADDPASDSFWYGAAPDGTPTVRLYYFYSPTCTHCQAAKPFVDGLEARHSWLRVERFAVNDDRANAHFYFDTAKALGFEVLSVPGFVFCRQLITGYGSASTSGKELEQALQACHDRRAVAPGRP